MLWIVCLASFLACQFDHSATTRLQFCHQIRLVVLRLSIFQSCRDGSSDQEYIYRLCLPSFQTPSIALWPGLLGQLDAPSYTQEVAGSILGSGTIFHHEVISTAILCLSLIQVGQLSVTGESMDT